MSGNRELLSPLARVGAALVLTLFAGCAEPLERPEEVTGTYVMDGGAARDELTVRADGRYVRSYALPGETAVVDSGTWEIERSSGEPRIVFSDFAPRWRAQAFPDVPMRRGYWSTYAERSAGGTVRINVNEDLGLAYVRKTPAE